MYGPTLLALLLGAGAPLAQAMPLASNGTIKCPIVFDGRVKSGLALADFDSAGASPFGADYVKGQGLKWSQILKFPSDAGSARFDGDDHKPVEVTLSDSSIFQTQKGFRRAGLQFNGDSNNGSPASSGIKTLHFSVKQDATRPLNLSHEYLAVWHEAADYSANQFNFELGAILGQDSLPKNTYKVLDRKNKQIWSTPIEKGEWQNFAIQLDYPKNTLQVYYSKGDGPLASVTKAVSNDNSGGGQFQIGLLKKPTGTSDVVNSGYQESKLNEGQIYGSVFVEDSANACISL